MRFCILILCLVFSSFSVVATSSQNTVTHLTLREEKASRTKTQSSPTTKSRTRTKASSATATKAHKTKQKQEGLTKAAKIGIGVGVPLGVIAIAGAIAAYIIGKRRGRKRRVDDPNAGAGKLIRDPSSDLNLTSPAQTPAVAELPTVQSDDFTGQGTKNSNWWNPFGRSESTKKQDYTLPPNAPRSPQEMPA